jgi:DNA-binding ferritin-like protein
MSKTKKKSKSKNQFNIVQFLLHLLISVKLYHWITGSYATHEATDKLYTSLNLQIDMFIEVMLGKGFSKENLNVKEVKFKKYSIKQFLSYINRCKKTLINLPTICKEVSNNDTDILNIRDEILSSLNQLTYLLSFS